MLTWCTYRIYGRKVQNFAWKLEILVVLCIKRLEANPHLTQIWQTAQQFGAVCSNQIDEQVTHVVAIDLGTDKVTFFYCKTNAWCLDCHVAREDFLSIFGFIEACPFLMEPKMLLFDFWVMMDYNIYNDIKICTTFLISKCKSCFLLKVNWKLLFVVHIMTIKQKYLLLSLVYFHVQFVGSDWLVLEQVNWALSTGRFVVHRGWWALLPISRPSPYLKLLLWLLLRRTYAFEMHNRIEASAYLYKRANEQDFGIKHPCLVCTNTIKCKCLEFQR